jgi:hypothetical protein
MSTCLPALCGHWHGEVIRALVVVPEFSLPHSEESMIENQFLWLIPGPREKRGFSNPMASSAIFPGAPDGIVVGDPVVSCVGCAPP